MRRIRQPEKCRCGLESMRPVYHRSPLGLPLGFDSAVAATALIDGSDGRWGAGRFSRQHVILWGCNLTYG
jgi:hypothetical protein